MAEGEGLAKSLDPTGQTALFAEVRTILPYPQYWAYVLSGVMASEATSFGAHTA